MRFLLLNPPMDYDVIKKEYSFEAYLPPLGLLYIASVLEREGHAVQVIDFIAEEFTEEKLRSYVKTVDIVCITVPSQVATSAAKITSFLKQEFPDTVVVIGGPHCTIQQEAIFDEIDADISVMGDGEQTILDIIKMLQTNGDLRSVRGIFFKEKGIVKQGLPSQEIDDLDSIPFPARRHIRRYEYGKQVISGVTYFARGKITSVITTRGCPFHCRFCISRAIFEKTRLRSAENVVEELEEIAEEYDSVFAVDDNFLMDKKRAHTIMDLLIQKKLDLDIWIAGARVTDADAALFKKMKKAGVKSLEFGIESGNPEVLDYYNKKITLAQVERAVKLSRQSGFLTIGNFILGAPIETDRHINDTIRFAKKLNLDFAFFYAFNFLKGSEIWEDAYREGKIAENETFVPCDSRRGLCHYTPEELRERVSSATIGFYTRPRYLLSQLFRQLFVYRNFRVYKAGLKLLLQQKESTLFNKNI